MDIDDTEVKFPTVEVELTGHDGNVFAIIGRVQRALRQAGASQEDLEQFRAEMTAGDYGDALRTVFRWVNVT